MVVLALSDLYRVRLPNPGVVTWERAMSGSFIVCGYVYIYYLMKFGTSVLKTGSFITLSKLLVSVYSL